MSAFDIFYDTHSRIKNLFLQSYFFRRKKDFKYKIHENKSINHQRIDGIHRLLHRIGTTSCHPDLARRSHVQRKNPRLRANQRSRRQGKNHIRICKRHQRAHNHDQRASFLRLHRSRMVERADSPKEKRLYQRYFQPRRPSRQLPQKHNGTLHRSRLNTKQSHHPQHPWRSDSGSQESCEINIPFFHTTKQESPGGFRDFLVFLIEHERKPLKTDFRNQIPISFQPLHCSFFQFAFAVDNRGSCNLRRSRLYPLITIH